MITVYLAQIEAFIEGEDIEMQFCIYKDSDLLSKKSISMDYVKPILVGQVALQRLLGEIKTYKGQEVLVLVHDTILFESVRGTLKTKHINLSQLAKKTQRDVAEFGNITIKNVSSSSLDLKKWAETIEENFN